jgi:prolyl 4-hydroxylase
MFIPRLYDSVIQTIEERIANWTLLPLENGEDLQVLRYQKGQKYEAHWDYFDDKTEGGMPDGQRYATLLTFLSSVEEGGETCFPNAIYIDEERQKPKVRGSY